MKNMKMYLFLFSFFALFFVFGCLKVKAINYNYTSGSVEKKYEDVIVNSFSYDYITTFNDNGILDNGVDVSAQNFYSGRQIEVNVKEVSFFLPWKKDSDATYIYKYDSTRNDFDSIITSFSNKEGTYKIDKDGLYKVEYVFDGSKKFTTYIYICKDIHQAQIVGNEKYSNSSAYSEFSFNLSLKDGYDLRKNKYYYAFGTDPSNLSFRRFEIFSDEEKKSGTSVHIFDKQMFVEILESDVSLNGQKKFLFVKIERDNKNEKLIQTEKKYELSDKIQAKVYLVDESGSVITKHKSYKRSDVIRFKVVLNVPVTYSDLQFTIDGNKYFLLSNSVEPVNEIKVEYLVDSYVDFDGNFGLLTKNNTNAVVRYDNTNVSLNVVEECDFDVDVSAPVINVVDSGDSVGRKQYKVSVTIDEENLKEVMYYADICTVSQNNYCLMSFDDSNPKIVKLGAVNNPTIAIDKTFGGYNGVNLALFIKTVDEAGNVSTDVKWGYVLDNVIVPNGRDSELFAYEDINVGGEVVGKKLLVYVPENYSVSSVSYSLGNNSKQVCVSDLFVYSGKYIYECLSVENYDFSTDVVIGLVDSFGNVEEYSTKFRFSMIKDGNVVVNGKVFNLTDNENYEVEFKMYNYMKQDEQLVFENSVFDMFSDELNLDKIPSFSDLKINLVYIRDEDVVVLKENIVGDFIVPSVWDLMELLKDNQEFKTCYKDKCDIDVYLQYEYKANGVNQSRFIKINYLDSSNKYNVVDDFSLNSTITVGESFNGFNYKYLNNLNMEVDEGSVNINKKIIFEDFSGNKKEVDIIDTSVLGKYIVKEYFECNSVLSFPLEYEIEVVDNIAPTIRLNGEEKIRIRVGDKFEDPLVTIKDNYDQDIKVEVKYDPVVDMKKPGTYVISYWCEDSSGNVSEIITRTLIVEEKAGKTVYLISGGIALFTLLVIGFTTLIEVKKEKRRV